ncbi:MAG: hypothetical protein ACJ8H8_19935 [Geminicoccaceae bacterium]
MRDPDGYRLRIDGSETKSRRPIALDLPGLLTLPIDHYLQHERRSCSGA